MLPPWRQKQPGSGCTQPMARQRERGCHAMGPGLFNHVQLYSCSPSCREITSPVMATKLSCPQHTGEYLKPNALALKENTARLTF